MFRKSSYCHNGACVEVDVDSFKKSSYSGRVNCVEVAEFGDAVLVRDSKDKGSPELMFTTDEWRAFIKGVKNGEFDI